MAKVKRLQAKVNGIVQGVGFRPFIYRLARDAGLSGLVRNEPDGVLIEVEGRSDKIDSFLKKLLINSPPLAVIENLTTSETEIKGDSTFIIEASHCGSAKHTLISPDVAVCDDCLMEMYDPDDRRFRYPFINCTNCGPRFTIIKDLAYDRENTTMVDFPMCDECLKEYLDPGARRFHAEPNACPRCGPNVTLMDNKGRPVPGDPIETTVNLLKKGAVVAVKGLGGFHLACDAADEDAVSRLRKGKRRDQKPFAIMAGDLEKVRKFCYVNLKEEELLSCCRRPIVLLKKKDDNGLIAESVAPASNYFGVMLPYTPLHHLITDGIPLGLVMTSGNFSSEPIIYRNEEVLEKLKDTADYFLLHNREIYQRCDDSVVTVFRNRELVLRRARGYAPGPVKLPFAAGEILACGAELNNTFCVTKGEYAFISQHIGDLKNTAAMEAFEEGIEHFKKVFDVNPRVIAHDLHTDYLSTKYALSQSDAVRYGIQHHHAHIASCMAENGVEKRIIGLSFDGTGYGSDGNLWGGEFLVCDYRDFERAGHLAYIPLVSGEKAIKEPWRIAAVYLRLAYGDDFTELPIPFTREMDHDTWRLLNISLVKGINAPLTSSVGRLFDAVSALLGICRRINYEGQAAIELEGMADPLAEGVYRYQLAENQDEIIVDPLPLIRDIVDDIQAGAGAAWIAGKFHNTVADFSAEMCAKIRQKRRINEVALSGGVFQNMLLLGKLYDRLTDEGFTVYTHSKVPPNDGGICLGQAVIAYERSRNHVFGNSGADN